MSMALIIAVAIIVGFVFAEIVHRIQIRNMKAEQEKNARIAEYMKRQLWQFISIDEWLEGPKKL